MQKTVDAIYSRGMVKPKRKLPFLDGAHLKLTILLPSSPVSRTRGIIRIAPRQAREIIFGKDTEADFYGA